MNRKEILVCDACKISGNTITAVVFCNRCECRLCRTCQNVHKQSKETKGHRVVDIYRAMENGVGKTSKCEIHRHSIESVCETHDMLVCRECIANQHCQCHDFTPLQRAAAGIHGTNSVQNTKHSLVQLTSRFDKMTNEETQALNSVDSKDKMFEDSVYKFRKDVDLLLDQLVVTLLRKKDELCKDEKAVLEERLSFCKDVYAKLIQTEEILNKISKKSDEQNAFIVMKRSKEVVDKYTDVAEEISEGKGRFSIKFEPNKDLVKSLDSIGSIKVKSTVQPVGVYEVKHQTGGRKLVQSGELLVSSPSDEYPCTITGCTLLGDSGLVLADETNSSLKLLNNEFKLIADLKMELAPWDVTAVSITEVVVRNSGSEKKGLCNKIEIVKIGTDYMKKVGGFTVDGRPSAIKYYNSELYIACSVENKAHILVLDKDFKVTKTIKPRDGVLCQPQYIAVAPSSKHLYVSDFYNGIVALNLKGDVLFKFKDSNLTEYGGITLDDSGDLYICAGKPYGIYHVIRDGKALTLLTTWKSGTIDPQAIMYNPKDGKFLVTHCTSNKAFIYSYEK